MIKSPREATAQHQHSRRSRDGSLWNPQFAIEVLLAIALAAVVYIQTERLSEQSAQQSDELTGWTANLDNVRFVRETVIGDSLTMPFDNMDLSSASFVGFHFGCTDEERDRATQWHDSAANPGYLGSQQLCRASFANSNLDGVNFQGAQLHRAIFEGATLENSNLVVTNLIRAWFSYADADGASFANALAREATFLSVSLIGATFTQADLEGARFDGADLSGSDFRDANLEGVAFTDVTCQGTRWPDGFEPPKACD